MENVASSKKLRKDALEAISNINLDVYNKTSRKQKKLNDIYDGISSKYVSDVGSEDEEYNFFAKFKVRLIVKIFVCSAILFSTMFCKVALYDKISSNKYISLLCNEYKKEYKKENVLNFIERASKKIYNDFNYAIPAKFAQYTKEKYNSIKPKIINFNLKASLKNVISPNSNASGNTSKTNTSSANDNQSISNSDVKTYQSDSSSINSTDGDLNKILEKHISIIAPTNGTITSKYGPRAEVIPGTGTFHTGVDIANKLNTNIVSATSGTVIDVEQDNKYYGKMIEIETDGVVFKYGHMNETKVEKGQNVTQGSLIGLMGKTGDATGTHLHFEVRIDDKSVDPEKLVKLGG